MTTLKIALSDLRPGAKTNVDSRKTRVPLDGLMRSLDQHGVIVPLLVRKNGDLTWDVIDGNRRLAALQALFKRDKQDPQEVMVPCVEMGEGNALEISMVANVERVDLHPVDRFEVYSTLVEGGVTVQDIANRYGMKLG